MITVISGVTLVKAGKQSGYIFSRVLDTTSEQPRRKTQHQRKAFTQQPIKTHKLQKLHTHPQSAADRNVANLFVRDVSMAMGCEPYSLEMSRSEQQRGSKGTRTYHWSKDMDMKPQQSPIPKDPLIYTIDVDYYMDMPSQLCDKFYPWILYTLVPTEAGTNTDEFTMHWNGSNQVVYKVSGGGKYQHQLWDYNLDDIFVKKTFCGIPYKAATYKVDRRNVASQHDLVSLTPMRRWRNPLSATLATFLHGNPLKRLEPVQDGFVRVNSVTKEGGFVSVAKIDDPHSTTLPVDKFSMLQTLATGSNKITLANCVAVMPKVNGSDLTEFDAKRVAVAPMYDYLRSNSKTTGAVVYPVEVGVRNYTYAAFSYGIKPSLHPFMTPLYHGAYAPTIDLANAKQAVKGRVDKIQHKQRLPTTPLMSSFLQEFVGLVVEALAPSLPLQPATMEEISERQPKPTQQRLLMQALCDNDKTKLGSFIKKEAYSGPKDPRLITVDQPRHKMEYSQFIYPAMDAFKRHLPFYMPGKTPLEVATRITQCLDGATNCSMGDMFRLDGTVSSYSREMWRAVLLAIHAPEYRDRILDLYENSFQKRVSLMTEEGKVDYESLWIILSGMLDTSILGTLISIFSIYVGLRQEKTAGFNSPAEIWEFLEKRCCAMGDDVLAGNLNPATLRKGAETIGCKSDAYDVQRGESGVIYLSRAYGPNVWYGDPTSMTCLKRQLAKFHTTVNISGVSAEEKLKEKARAFLLTDRNTPILGQFCQKVEQICGPLYRQDRLAIMERWNSQLELEVQYPNDYAEWMLDTALEDLPGFDLSGFAGHLSKVRNVDDLLAMPTFAPPDEPKVKEPVILDGDIISPQEEQPAEPVNAKKKQSGSSRRKRKGEARIVSA
jgi:hypothetical protein